MIPADADLWTWWLPMVLVYLAIGFVIWLCAAGAAEEMDEDSFGRVTLATYAAFWLVWPLATVALIVWLAGFGAVATVLDAWRIRNGGKS